MAVEWTGVGPELLLGVDRCGGEPLGQQLQTQLRDAIRAGRLEQGERLPSSRALAAQLGVSRGLVVDCYAQLESEGYLHTADRTSTLVASGPSDKRADGYEKPAQPEPADPGLEIDFAYGIPDLRSFPMRDWMWAMGVAGRTATPNDLGDEADLGSARLRGVLSSYLRRVRGSAARAEDVAVCAGFRYGLNLVLRALTADGIREVALEDPGPADHDEIARRSGLSVLPVAVDERGLDVEALARTSARVVVVTPAHQAPTGVLLAPERRQALVEWAHRVDGFVIEDDYDAEFRYDRQPVGSLHGLAPDRIIAMGSTSKTLTPTVRLGWLVCPPRLHHQVGVEKHLLGRGAPGLDQLALAALIESGRYDKHLRRMRGVYGRRRQALVDAVARHAPDVVVTGLAAGCHAVVRLRPRSDEQQVIADCARRGVGVYGMSRYRSERRTEPPQLVLGFGNVRESAIAEAVARIAPLL